MSWPWWAGLLCALPFLFLPLATLLLGRPRPNLREWKPIDRKDAPRVSVIVPARNEQSNIERCVRSLLHSRYPDFEVIVVDDRSTDRTPKILDKLLASSSEQLAVVTGTEPPEGWFGKQWACWQGFQQARGSVLLFTDADTEHGPDMLGRAVAMLEAERADFVTVMPRQEMRGFWECVVQPYFFGMLGLVFGPPSRLNRNTNPRRAIANGQFILVTRDSYEWIGGHQKVRHTVGEDLMLAVEYTAGGKRLRFAMADEDMSTRMYSGLPAIVEGWSKNSFVGAWWTTGSKPLAYMGVVFGLLLDALFVVPLPLAALGAALRWPAVVVFGLTAWLATTWWFWMLLRASRAPVWPAPFHPLGAVVQAWIMVRAALRGGRRIEWKGRTYSQSRL